jgi:DnaK suppressor protein
VDPIARVLEEKRAKLEAELARLSAPLREPTGISFGKRVGDGTSMAVDRLVEVAAHDHLGAVLADVHRALAKIDDLSYGKCDGCGTEIPPERLETLPWAVLCVRCADRR